MVLFVQIKFMKSNTSNKSYLFFLKTNSTNLVHVSSDVSVVWQLYDPEKVDQYQYIEG